MQKARIMPALGAGFDLWRREPLSVLVWGLILAVLTLGPALLTLGSTGPDMIKFYTDAFTDPAAAGTPPASLLAAQPLQLLQLPLGLIAIAIIYPAIMRAVLRPEEKRRAFIRFGATEFYFGVFVVVLYVLAVIAVFVVAFGAVIIAVPIGLVIGMSGGGGGGVTGAVVSVVVILALFFAIGVAFLYVLIRLWMAAPLIVATGQLKVFDGWAMTRGYAWPLVGLAILTWLIAFVMEVFGVSLLIALGMITSGQNPMQWLADRERLAASMPGLLMAYAGFASVMVTVITPITVAPWARAFQLMGADKGGDAAIFS